MNIGGKKNGARADGGNCGYRAFSAGAAALLLRVSLAAIAPALSHCAAPPPAPAAQGAPAPLLAQGLDRIRKYYIDPISTRKLALFGAQNLARLDPKLAVSETPGAGAGYEFVLSRQDGELAAFPEPADGDIDSWARLLDRLVADAKTASPTLAAVPPERVDTALFAGMTGALDPFSRYSPPKLADVERALRDGFGGIGITLDDSKKGLQVTAVLPHGPAQRAGIRPHDWIVAIDGKAPASLSKDEILAHLRGSVGSAINLAVYRPDPPRNLSFMVKRGLIVLPAVRVSEAGGIIFFRIATFNESTAKIVTDRLLSASRNRGEPLKGLVLDLRGNPGGLLEQAAELVDLFLKDGPIVSTTGRNPLSDQYFVASGDGIAATLPVVVLIDAGSASASEIVASALQDRGRAVILGGSSYGKGTVQTVLPLPNGGALTVTWARLITPEGYLLHHHGVVPNLCTDALDLDADATPQRIREAGAAAARSPLAREPRAALDEAGWAALRRSCPGRHRQSAIDLKTAARLLADPELYRQALRLVPAAPSVAVPAPARPAATTDGPARTSSGALLFFVRHPA